MKKISKFIFAFTLISVLSAPFLVYAQSNCGKPGFTGPDDAGICYRISSNSGGSGGLNPTYLQSYSDSIINVINGILVPALIAIAFITFLWGVYRYFILGAADETKREEGRSFILWGLIGFVVITSLWALVNIVATTFDLSPGGKPPKPPTI